MAWSLPEGCVLGIFGKQPVPGKVKTRLAAGLGDDAAAAIHEAMLFDTLDDLELGVDPGPGRPAGAGLRAGRRRAWFDSRVPEAFALQPQVEGDLGTRMREFFAGEFEDGATRVVLIGSDSPTLDPTIVITAFLCLEGRDVVIGPSTDGGYYLIGASGIGSADLRRDRLERPSVLGQTIDRLRDTGLSLAVLPPGTMSTPRTTGGCWPATSAPSAARGSTRGCPGSRP